MLARDIKVSGQTSINHGVPCVVCLVRERFIAKMFPGKKNWSMFKLKEYYEI